MGVFAGVESILGPVLDPIYGVLTPVWIEVCFLLCFIIGYLTLRFDSPQGKQVFKKRAKTIDEPFTAPTSSKEDPLQLAVDQESAPALIVSTWKNRSNIVPTPRQLWRPIVQALIEHGGVEFLKTEVVAHMRRHRVELANSLTVFPVLDIVARAGHVCQMVDLHKIFSETFNIPPTLQTYEVLLGGYATAGDEAKAADIMAEAKANKIEMSARGYCLMIKGFLKNSKIDATMKVFADMTMHGYRVPAFGALQLLRIAGEARRTEEFFDSIVEETRLCSDAIANVLEYCVRCGSHKKPDCVFRRQKFAFAKRVVQVARTQNIPLNTSAFDSLIKLHASHADQEAFSLFQDAQNNPNVNISEGLCVGILARCADSKFLDFATEVFAFCSSRGSLSIALYSALMKVYAFSNMFDKACDLYDQVLADGLEPDATMYGCLMRFAVECGRTDLSQRLSSKAPSMAIQSYMSLIRAAGRDGDVDSAFNVLESVKSIGVSMDTLAYNSLLDVCASAGYMDRAKRLVQEIKEQGLVDLVTFNTLLKGYCTKRDFNSALGVLEEIRSNGLQPNEISYNCVLNAAASCNRCNFTEVWKLIKMMERDQIKLDHYTMSILMKALKKSSNPNDVRGVLELLDKSGIEVTSEEVLLNAAVETYTKHGETRRLTTIFETYESCNFKCKCSLYTCGSLIKAAGVLKRLPLCWSLWNEMIFRHKEPTEVVLGCMLDALTSNGQVDKAMALMESWRNVHAPNTVMCSIIMKGFASERQPERAMRWWRELRVSKVPMNGVLYNAVTDAQARAGFMTNVSELLAGMESDGVKPDTITFSTVVKGYCVKGQIDQALEVFRNMQKNDMVKDAIVYNTMLDGCCRHHRYDVAEMLTQDMENNQIPYTNFTLANLFKLCGKKRQIDRAFDLLETCPRKHGFVANSNAKMCLITACVENGEVSRAIEVFGGMRDIGEANDKVYSSFVNALLSKNHLNNAIEIVEDALGLAGLPATPRESRLDDETLKRLIRTLSRGGNAHGSTASLLDRLKAARASVDDHWSRLSTRRARGGNQNV